MAGSSGEEISFRMSEDPPTKGEGEEKGKGSLEIVKKVLILYTGGTVGMSWSAEIGEFCGQQSSLCTPDQ
jgi:L-asparaginase/Glu-tRNA(Gln) amidotransferase subunit D